ncbi:MAG: MFS transporter [Deltaproteobacteria bacterium]|nr:MFS transporter [Deltaproteobacteria bacterium]
MLSVINRTFASLLIRNYRLYFIGQAISLCGTWMQMIGQSWLVLRLTHSGTQLGLVAACQFLPILVLGPWGGLISDQFSKRKLLFGTQIICGILALALGILVVTNTVTVWMVYLIGFMFGLVNTVDIPTRQTFVPEMVGADRVGNAVSLNSTAMNLARVVGPAVGAGLIATFGVASCFFVNAISFLAVIIVLALMRTEELHPTPRAQRTKGQLKLGFLYVVAHPLLAYTLLMMVIIGTLAYEFTVTLPLIAEFTFHGNAESYAHLFTAMGIGSIAGGLMTAGRRTTSPQLLVASAGLFGVTLVLAAVMPTLLFASIAFVAVGFFSIIFLTLGNTTLQLGSAPEMRGRVMALWAMAFIGSTPIGGPIVGWIGEFVGPRWAVGVGGIAAIIAAIVGGVGFWRSGHLTLTRNTKPLDEGNNQG